MNNCWLMPSVFKIPLLYTISCTTTKYVFATSFIYVWKPLPAVCNGLHTMFWSKNEAVHLRIHSSYNRYFFENCRMRQYFTTIGTEEGWLQLPNMFYVDVQPIFLETSSFTVDKSNVFLFQFNVHLAWKLVGNMSGFKKIWRRSYAI